MLNYIPSYFNGKTKLVHEKYPEKHYEFVYSDLSEEARMIEMPSGRQLEIPYATLQDMILMYEHNGWRVAID